MGIPVILHGQKPKLTAQDVGAVPTSRKVNNKVLSSDITLNISDVEGSNENLIVNGYFLDPINTKGQTEYTTATNENDESINKWLIDSANITLQSDGILIKNIEWYGRLRQKIDASLLRFLAGKQVTLSVLAKVDNASQLQISIFNVSDNTSEETNKYQEIQPGISLVTVSFIVPESYKDKWCEVLLYGSTNHPNDSTYAIKYIAAKLELGDTQTLAHKENGEWVLNNPIPNRDLELVKTQGAVTLQNGMKWLGDNPITSTTDDTPLNWVNLGSGYAYYNTTSLNEQPGQFGLLLNVVNNFNPAHKDVFQLFRPSTGVLWVRSGYDPAGWTDSWSAIYDTGYKPTANDVGALPSNPIQYNVDFNTLTSDGIYECYSDGNNDNTPYGNDSHTHFQVMVLAHNSIYVHQIAFDVRNSQMFHRMCNNGTWTGWGLIYTALNKPQDYIWNRRRTLTAADLNNPNYPVPYVASYSEGPDLGLFTGWWHILYFRHEDNNGFGAQFAIPLNYSGDKTPMYRTSEGTTWSSWLSFVINNKTITSGTGALTAGSSALNNGNIYLQYE